MEQIEQISNLPQNGRSKSIHHSCGEMKFEWYLLLPVEIKTQKKRGL